MELPSFALRAQQDSTGPSLPRVKSVEPKNHGNAIKCIEAFTSDLGSDISIGSKKADA